MAQQVKCVITFASGGKPQIVEGVEFAKAFRKWSRGKGRERGYWYTDDNGSHFINFLHVEKLTLKEVTDEQAEGDQVQQLPASFGQRRPGS